MSELVHLSADVDTQTIVDTLTCDGALILDNVVDSDFLAALRSETDPYMDCLLYTSPSPRDRIASRMPSSA